MRLTSLKQLRAGGFAVRGWLIAVGLSVISGCGGISAEVQEAQDAQIQELYEEATKNPPNLSPAAAQRRKERVEMDFGISPDQEDDQPR